MNKSDVEDYIAHEKDSVNEQLSRSLDQRRTISTKELFPEFKLETPYTTSLEPYSKIWEVLPFSKELVVQLNLDLPDESKFEKFYGVSVETLLWLKNRGRIDLVAILPREPQEIPSYLDALLEERPPSRVRLRALSEALISGREDKEGILRKINLITEKLPMSVDGVGNVTQEPRERVFRTTRDVCYQLLVLGYDKEFDDVVRLSTINPEASRRLLDLYRLFLTGSHYYSLEGLHRVSSRTLTIDDLGNLPFQNSDTVVFPSEVAGVLIGKLELVRPHSYDHALDICPNYEKALESLNSLDMYLKEKSMRESKEVANEVTRLFDETLLSLERKQEKLAKIIDVVCVGGLAVPGFLLGGLPGLFAGLFSNLGVQKYVAKPVSNKLVRIGQGSSIITLFDFDKSVKEWRARH